MKLGDRRKTVRETLRAQIQERLHEHIDLQRIVRLLLVADVAVVLVRIGQVFEDAQHLIGGALLPDGNDQLESGRGARQCGCRSEREIER